MHDSRPCLPLVKHHALRPLKATCIRAMISGVCTEDPKCFQMCLNNMTWVQSSGPPISPRLPRKTRVERSGKEDALLKRQAQKAEAQLYAWVEDAHREYQEKERDAAERRARRAAKRAEKRKKREEKKKKKAKTAERRGTRDKSSPKPFSPPPARS